MTHFPWLELIVSQSVVLGVALYQAAAPGAARSKIWFGITVADGFSESPEGRSIRRRYLSLVALHTFIASGLVALGVILKLPLVTVSGSVWILVATSWAYVSARKRTSPFAVEPAQTTREVALHTTVPELPGGRFGPMGPLILLVAVSVYLAFSYAGLPDQLPKVFQSSQETVQLVPKTFRSVFGPLGIGLFSIVVGLGHALAVVKGSRRLSTNPTAAAAETRFKRVILWNTLVVEYASVVTASAMALKRVFPVIPSLNGISVIFAVVTFVVLLRLGQGGWKRAGRLATSTDHTPDAAWKLGTFYYNAQDPAVLVERRFGVGFTYNFASRWSWALLATLILGMFTVPLLLST